MQKIRRAKRGRVLQGVQNLVGAEMMSTVRVEVECGKCGSVCDQEILFTWTKEVLVECVCKKCDVRVSRILITIV